MRELTRRRLLRQLAPAAALAEGQQCVAVLKELTASDPTNAVYQRNIGLCYEKLAVASERAANDERAAPAQRVKQLTAARAWYQKELEVFSDLRDRHTLMAADAGKIETLAAKINKSQEAFAQPSRAPH